MKSINLRKIAEVTGGKLFGGREAAKTEVTNVVSDSRKAKEGSLFLCIPGEKTDGHKYAQMAYEAGAACCLMERKVRGYTGSYILVGSVKKASQELAEYYRKSLDIKVVAITGSVGKTSAKEFIAAVLSKSFKVHKTAGNFNNNIGLPRTIFTIAENAEAAVLEMGMNHAGEISYLTGIARPTGAVITNIGEAHIGNLGSRENIFKAKCEIFEGLTEGGFAILNGDDPYLKRLRGDPDIAGRFRLIYVGEGEDCDFRAADIDDTLSESLRFTALTPMGTFPVTVPAIGRHLIYPALTAAAVGAEL